MVIAVPLIALIGVTSASLVLQHNEEQERQVSLTASALTAAAQQVLTDALNAETGVRGYAATRDPLFLQPYNLDPDADGQGPRHASPGGRRRGGQRRGAGRGRGRGQKDGRAGPAALRDQHGRLGHSR